MTTDELKELVTLAGYNCRIARDQVVLEVCYFCGNERWNLELSAVKGVFSCWVCKKSGRLERILHDLTGQRHNVPVTLGARAEKKLVIPQDFKSMPVGEVYSARTYLTRRGVTPEVATQYGMVVCVQEGYLLEGRICIPARDFWTGDVLGWVGRSYTGGVPKYMSTMPKKVICGWQRHTPKLPAVVVEGLLDAITIHQAGYSAAALLGTGGTGLVEWASRLDPECPVAVMLDGDAIEQARKTCWQISAVRSTVILIPLEAGADPAAVGSEGVRNLVERALNGLKD